MRALPTLGGNNGFATGANSRGQIVGWAENSVHDPTCVPPQQLQFRPVVYGPNANQISELPLPAGDTSGAATGINEQGQAVGISGICDQAVGRYTAKHALLWDKNGKIVDLGNLGARYWNTPTNINQRGDVVGFAGAPNDPDGNFLQAFIWTRESGIQASRFPSRRCSQRSLWNQRAAPGGWAFLRRGRKLPRIYLGKRRYARSQ